MRSLRELYESQIISQAGDKPALVDALFIALYGSKDLKAKTKEMGRRSEDIFEPFYEKWKERITTQLQEHLNADMDPAIVNQNVLFVTKDELIELFGLLDTYIPESTQEAYGLKVYELKNHYDDMAIIATELLRELYQKKMMEKKAGPKILTGPGLVNPQGRPIGTVE